MATIRILTANLWATHSSPDGLARVLTAVDPDLLAVQELHGENAAVIGGAFPYYGLEPHWDTLGSGVASRWPAGIDRLPMTYRSGWTLRLDPADVPGLVSPLELVNVHLANPVGRPWLRTLRSRRHQIGALLTHAGTSATPCVVVGDFNASPAWPAYRSMAGVFTDGALEAGTAVRTWRFQGRTPPLLRIDHAFGRGVVFRRTEALAIPGADHLGLLVTIDV